LEANGGEARNSPAILPTTLWALDDGNGSQHRVASNAMTDIRMTQDVLLDGYGLSPNLRIVYAIFNICS
jgi:hypothetical protein